MAEVCQQTLRVFESLSSLIHTKRKTTTAAPGHFTFIAVLGVSLLASRGEENTTLESQNIRTTGVSCGVLNAYTILLYAVCQTSEES